MLIGAGFSLRFARKSNLAAFDAISLCRWASLEVWAAATSACKPAVQNCVLTKLPHLVRVR
jgi:hypothetical protein